MALLRLEKGTTRSVPAVCTLNQFSMGSTHAVTAEYLLSALPVKSLLDALASLLTMKVYDLFSGVYEVGFHHCNSSYE